MTVASDQVEQNCTTNGRQKDALDQKLREIDNLPGSEWRWSSLLGSFSFDPFQFPVLGVVSLRVPKTFEFILSWVGLMGQVTRPRLRKIPPDSARDQSISVRSHLIGLV